MSVETLARTIRTAVDIARNTNGKARKGIYTAGVINCDGTAYSAVCAVPINLYDGKSVWVQVADNGVAVIIGD